MRLWHPFHAGERSERGERSARRSYARTPFGRAVCAVATEFRITKNGAQVHAEGSSIATWRVPSWKGKVRRWPGNRKSVRRSQWTPIVARRCVLQLGGTNRVPDVLRPGQGIISAGWEAAFVPLPDRSSPGSRPFRGTSLYRARLKTSRNGRKAKDTRV